MKGKNVIAAIDLDGTLLDDKKNLSVETLDFFYNRWKGYLAFVTGRDCTDVASIQNTLQKNGISDYYLIYEDGQYLMKISSGNEKKVAVFPFIDNATCELFQSWAKLSRINYSVFTTNNIYHIMNSELTIKQFAGKVYRYICKNGSNVFYNRFCPISPNEHISKISFHADSKHIEELLVKLNELLNKKAYAVYNDNKIEVKCYGTSKLDALKLLLENIHLSDDRCLYFGNDGNDIECLKYFPNSYAVANADDNIRQAAKKIVLSNNDNGVLNELRIIAEIYFYEQ